MNTFLRLEQCLLPPPETVRWNEGNLSIEQYTTLEKVTYCTKKFFAFTVLLIASPLTLTYDWLTQKQIRSVQRIPDIAPRQPSTWPPEERGFACSLFQTSGLGTKWSATPGLAGKCDWDQWMDDPKHIRHPEGFDYKNFFIDILSDPTAYINMLRSQNVTAHRFSLEWSVIEPNPGQIDMDAVACYRNFIQALIAAGITPSVTLNHFVVPEWFYKKGNFQKMENIDFYVQFALRAMELFPNVKSWWSFNELGIKAFQQTREVFPTDLPEGSSLAKRVHAAGRSTMNMLIAHCKLTQEVLQRHPDKRIGVTHQWLKFDTATENCLERLVAHVFTKFAFTPVYQFFKEGRFSFEIPLMANIQFEVPKEQFEANGKFLMQLGVQAYPQAMIKMGLNHGKTYPGLSLGNKNPLCFIFGSTCEPGGTLMRFGPRWRAEGMDEALDEAFKLTDQVYITEYGSDAMTQSFDAPNFQRNDEAQAHYLQQLTERIRNYSRRIKGLYCWSDVRQMEWNEGQECKLSMITPVVNSDQRMVDWEQTHAARYLQEAYREEPLFQATAVSNGA